LFVYSAIICLTEYLCIYVSISMYTVRFERPNASALVPGAAKEGAALPGKDQALVAAKGGGEAELVRDPAGKFTDEEIYEVIILSFIYYINYIHIIHH